MTRLYAALHTHRHALIGAGAIWFALHMFNHIAAGIVAVKYGVAS